MLSNWGETTYSLLGRNYWGETPYSLLIVVGKEILPKVQLRNRILASLDLRSRLLAELERASHYLSLYNPQPLLQSLIVKNKDSSIEGENKLK